MEYERVGGDGADMEALMRRQNRRLVQQNMQENLQDAREQSPRYLGAYICWAFVEAVATTVMLLLYWGSPCDKPLRWFLLVFALRFVVSVPLTVHRFRALRAGDDAELSKYLLSWLDLVYFVWFVAGNVWVFGSDTCRDTAPQVWWYALAVVSVVWLSLCLPLIVLLALFACFPCVVIVMQLLAEPDGADEDVIASLPSRTYDPDGAEEKAREPGDDPPSCCICMNDYQFGDEIRELPCKHAFHLSCGTCEAPFAARLLAPRPLLTPLAPPSRPLAQDQAGVPPLQARRDPAPGACVVPVNTCHQPAPPTPPRARVKRNSTTSAQLLPTRPATSAAAARPPPYCCARTRGSCR